MGIKPLVAVYLGFLVALTLVIIVSHWLAT
jgi:hypothetical protein